jgi:formylglycine-generating enzyme required for sulfatase activity
MPPPSGTTPLPRRPGTSARRETSGWAPPDEFDEYRLIRLIGRGASGLVYLAHDTLLDRLVAVKFITALDPDAVSRFLIEARAAARLQHPNVVTLYRVGQLDERPYMVSEFIRGQSMDRISKPVSPERALELAIGLARGLAAAHRRGVLHRDIKPGNAIVADSGEVKLLDFGLAKFIDAPPAPTETPTDAAGLVVSISSPQLTHHGALVGTPYYMAPEMWRGELATRRSDVYSLGALLFEVCSGKAPHRDVPAPDLPTAAQQTDPQPLATRAPSLDPNLAAIVDRCLRRNPAERFPSAEEMRDAIERLTAAPRTTTVPEGNPYRGLQAFGAEHRSLFFGRAAEVRAVLERLRSEHFVLVAGDSGVGKSSLCGAGVLPRVGEGALGDGRSWTVIRLVPGRRPLLALATALATGLGMDEEAVKDLAEPQPALLVRELRRHLRRSHGLLIFLDQLEELVTMGVPEEAADFAELCTQLVSGVAGLRMLATVRSDFLARLAALPGLGDEVPHALYLLRPLSREGTREAVVGPAYATGVHFESEELVDTLVDSTARADAGLPLLQFTLAELWEARDQGSGLIRIATLEAMGGVAGALARHADGVLDRMLPGQRRAARRILLKLVTLEGTRARRTESELTTDEPARGALDALVRGRLLVAREAEDGAAYEVTHEALLGGWTRLRAWLEEEAESRALHQRLEAAATDWDRLGRPGDALWGARQLGEVAMLDPVDLAPREQEFVVACEEAVRRGRWIRRGMAVAVPLLVGLVWGGMRLHSRYDVTRQVDTLVREGDELLNRAREQDERGAGITRAAFAAFDARRREEAEASWATSRSLGTEADRGYAKASQALEKALALDAGRADVRERLAEVILDRALLLERLHRPVDSEEVAVHLALYDVGGERRRRWLAPATVSLRTSPADAELRMERYEIDDRGGRHPVDSGPARSTPVSELQLEPGSYRFRIAAAGRAPVLYPILLKRGEHLDIHLDIPPPAEIPAGFVYVPPGRFLFGSAADESTRRDFFNTVPLHEVRTEAFLIARTETTFQEWLEFLGALPPAERARRTPRTAATLFHGALALKQLADSTWELMIKPSTKSYTAKTGAPIIYSGRSKRPIQDWRHMPVLAISADDAEAYARWLNETGRVPGARLCTEYEWERAARGADDREFPHGDHLDPDDANYDATYGKVPLAFGPDEVGSHPASRSPFGIDDLVGNVWEWTRSSLTDGEHATRGGCYYFSPPADRIPNREVPEPTFRDMVLGLRLCANPRAR